MKIGTMEQITKKLYYAIYRSTRLNTFAKVTLVYTTAYPTLYVCKLMVMTRIIAPALVRKLKRNIKQAYYTLRKWNIEAMTGLEITIKRIFR